MDKLRADYGGGLLFGIVGSVIGSPYYLKKRLFNLV